METPILDYALLKVRSGINNESFNIQIKNINDYTLLQDIVNKTGKSFFGLEKAFVQYLEQGKAYFYISAESVKNVYTEKDSNYVIQSNIIYEYGTSYATNYSGLNTEILKISNLIYSLKKYRSGFNDIRANQYLDRSIADFEHALKMMKNKIEQNNDLLDSINVEFKEKMKDLFFKAVSVRSNGLLSEEGLKNRLVVNMLTFTPEEVKEGFEEKLEKSRLNFLNDLKDKLKNIDETKIDDDYIHEGYGSLEENELLTVKYETSDEVVDPEKFFKEGSENLMDSLGIEP